ncbi:hypothetical protein [Vulcanisaeta distributa]|uniref:hypothetical protein n=1 Tax=Vulcanisaeta distributa TaxID=164451 RepID=UPI0006D1164D|nr:hypothetical protein [Vulcanisaeta distributa]
MYFDGTVVATVTANGTGYVSGSFTVPSTAAVGSHTVVAVGQTSGVTYVSLFYVTVAKIALSQTVATVGTAITVSGSGFPANQYVVLCFNNVVVNTAYTSSSGTFVTNFTVPQTPNGTYPVVAMASLNAVPIGSQCPFIGETYEGGYASSSLTVVPSLVVNVTQTCPTFGVSVVGYGFWPGTNVTVYLNGTLVGYSLIGSNGTFEKLVTFPAPTTPGTYVITVNETFMGYPTPVSISVMPPYVQVNGQSSASGIAGGTVTVSGACFPPNSNTTLYINEVQYLNVTLTNSTGGFSVNVNLPLLPPGTYTVYAVVGNYTPTITSSINASVTILKPQIVSVTPTAGGEGSCFVIKGINFANTTLYSVAVTINGVTYTYGIYSEYANGSSVANAFGISCSQNVTLYPNGTVILPVVVPVTTPGTYTVYVNSTVHQSLISPTGVPSTEQVEIVPSFITAPNDTLYATTSFTVQPSYITVTPTLAVGGQQILITGYNFYPNSPVTIIINGTNVTSTEVGSNGQFSVVYTIPSYLTSGVLYIVAEENYTSYIAGTPPNAVGNATATVTIVSFYIAVLDDLEKLLQCCSSVNATLQQLMSEVEGGWPARLVRCTARYSA